MGINNTQRGGAGAGRGDDPHGVTRVNRFSATTRKGMNPDAGAASGSQASSDVRNTGGLDAGEGMSMVRSKYKESRKAGLSPDDARGAALNPLSYSGLTGPGGKQGPDIKMATDYKGDAV